MPRNAAVAISNNFSGGLITQATGLNFPENACTETWNCVFLQTGEVHRRLGFNTELNSEPATINFSNVAINSYLWRDVAGDGDTTFVVVQIGSTLYFYDAGNADGLSVGLVSDTVDLTTFSPSGAADPSLNECQFAAGMGHLFVTHPHLDSFSVTWDGTNIDTTQIDLTIRDLAGVEDGHAVADRPTASMGSIDNEHKYNLYNQGWSATNLATWDAGRSDLPSNADIEWSFKNASDVFSLTEVANVYRGNSPAPRGHFILNLYNQDRTTASGVTIAAVTTDYHRASTCAFFAGRVWYSGITSSGYTSRIYFSRIIEKVSQFGECYQQNDPTSEDAYDLLPSDGGVIDVIEAGQVFKLYAVQDTLLVFASNGVWSITGSAGIGFAANDYAVRRVSSQPSLSSSTFVDVNGVPAWWTADGIYTISTSQDGAIQVASLSDDTIKDFYLAIPPSSKKTARGFYNTITKTIQWLYRSTEAASVDEAYSYDQILVLNTLTKAFYPWSINTTDVKIRGLIVVDAAGGAVSQENVTDNSSVDVTDNASEDVYVYNTTGALVLPSFKYLVSYVDGSDTMVTFAEERDTSYTDWLFTGAGEDYTSHFISGYQIRGDAQRKFQSNYVYIFSDASVDTEYFFQAVWNFGRTRNSGKWSVRQFIRHTTDEFAVQYRRLKVRGTGIALQFKLTSVPGQPFFLYGWSALETSNASI